ncbi:MAG: molecular chaperone TorD family protein [Betaproteobacteria bacterium]|nr:molecular chaperone TorD family protein [Betaproteobacteria bacterium]
MTPNETEQAAARADFARFLSAGYYEPAPEFAQERLFDSMAAAGGRIGAEFADGARRLGEAFGAQSLQDLLVDYTRLFLGPVDAKARPYGSVWLGPDKLTMQESTMALLALYEEGGFEMAEDFRELPDHVAAELEFLYLLLFRESRARSPAAGEPGDPVALRRRLLDEHLGAWIRPFAEAVKAGAHSAFYRELGDLTGRFVAMEARRAAAG